MNSNANPLNRIYFENQQDREYLYHQQRLKNIKPSLNLIETKQQIKQREKRSQSHHQQAFKHKQEQIQVELQRENKALISKLLEINDGRFSIATQMNIERQPLNQERKRSIKAKRSSSRNEGQDEKKEKGQQRIQRSASGGTALKGNNYLIQKREKERIDYENKMLANRMIQMPPVVIKKDQLDKEYKEIKQIKKRVMKFDPSKRRGNNFENIQNGFQSSRIVSNAGTVNNLDNSKRSMLHGQIKVLGEDDGLDEKNQELMNLKIQLIIKLIDISFINFLPVNWDQEKYFMEIKAGSKPARKTTPELYMDFSKSIINEFLLVSDLKQSKLVYIALYQKKDSHERFLGDFELDLEPFYKSNCTHSFHRDLRNYKEMQNLPNYMPKDMRRKGWIDFEIIVRSNLDQYLKNLKTVREEEDDLDARNNQSKADTLN